MNILSDMSVIIGFYQFQVIIMISMHLDHDLHLSGTNSGIVAGLSEKKFLREDPRVTRDYY